MAAPTSQKADRRPISFRLEDGKGGVTTLPLVIRPEDLTYLSPALQTVIPTLGGAFLDDFGPGLSSIQISGHTGWGSGFRPPGDEEFKKVRQVVWTGWHRARADAVSDGRDVRDVKLIFVDELDEIVAVVAPGQFQLKRNQSRPLLFMYQIGMTVLSEDIAPLDEDPLNFSSDGSRNSVLAGINSIQSSVDKIASIVPGLQGSIDSSLFSPLRDMSAKATSAFHQVVGVVSASGGVVDHQGAQYISVAKDFALVGRNAFNTVNAIGSLVDSVSHDVATVAGAFNNAHCVLANTFRAITEYPDYSALYGASNCSSTVGGSPLSPLAGENPWETVLSPSAAVAAVSPDARQNMDVMKLADPILRPMSTSELASRAAAIASGVVFPWQ